MHGLGHTGHFSGPFDIVMAFFFYVPNLLVAELFLRASKVGGHVLFQTATALVLNGAPCLWP